MLTSTVLSALSTPLLPPSEMAPLLGRRVAVFRPRRTIRRGGDAALGGQVVVSRAVLFRGDVHHRSSPLPGLLQVMFQSVDIREVLT